ncbi:MAG TPA: STAS domain-containing protein [Solirubrobacterales bacterium]|nr:STAS domain-containing protein [Solirubrobacterales bacterium]
MRPVDDLNLGSRDLTGKPAEIRTQRDGDSLTITVCGEIDLSTADDLDGAIRDAEDDREIGRIVVDLSDLAFLDSSGLSVLLKASLRSREDGNRLSFVPSKHEIVTSLIALTGTGEMFD